MVSEGAIKELMTVEKESKVEKKGPISTECDACLEELDKRGGMIIGWMNCGSGKVLVVPNGMPTVVAEREQSRTTGGELEPGAFSAQGLQRTASRPVPNFCPCLPSHVKTRPV